MDALRAAKIDCLVVSVAQWPRIALISSLVAALDVPSALYASTDSESVGEVTAGAAAASILEAAPTRNCLLIERFRDTENDRLLQWLRGAGALQRMKRGRILMWGGAFGADVPCTRDDEAALENRLVKEILIEQEMVLVDAARAILSGEPQRVDRFLGWLRQNKVSIRPDGKMLTEEVLRFSAGHYLAAKDRIAALHGENILGTSVKCHFEVSTDCVGCTLCFVPGFLPFGEDSEGPREALPVACEGDLKALLTMVMLHQINPAVPPLFGDTIWFREHSMLLSNCGSSSVWWAGRSSDPRKTLAHVSLEPQLHGKSGSSVFSVTPPGKVTYARLFRVRGRYFMYLGAGEVPARRAEDRSRAGMAPDADRFRDRPVPSVCDLPIESRLPDGRGRDAPRSRSSVAVRGFPSCAATATKACAAIWISAHRSERERDMAALRLGLIPAHRPVMDRNFSIDRRARLLRAFGDLPGVQIIAPTEETTDGGLVSNERDARATIELFEKSSLDGIVLGVLGYGDEKSALAIVERFKGLPVLLVAMKEPVPKGGFLQGASLGGMLPISYGLHKRNIPFTFAGVCDPEDAALRDQLLSFARVCHAVRKFRGARIGMIGFRPYDFEVCIFNEGLLLERYGAKTVPLNLIDLEHQIAGISDNDAQVSRIVKEIQGAFSPGCGAAELAKLAKLELTMLRYAEEYRLDALTIQCWSAIQERIGLTPCLTNGRVSSLGIPVACEGDALGALSLLLQQWIADDGSVPWLADILMLHPEERNLFLAWHCGNAQAELAAEGSPAQLRGHCSYEEGFAGSPRDLGAGRPAGTRLGQQDRGAPRRVQAAARRRDHGRQQ